MDLCMLEIITLLPKNFKKDMAFGITNSKSWHSFERLLYVPVNIEFFLLLNFVLVNYAKYAFVIIKFGCHKFYTLFVSIGIL
jgi:hypothetical protein